MRAMEMEPLLRSPPPPPPPPLVCARVAARARVPAPKQLVPVSERDAVAGTITSPPAKSEGTEPENRKEKRPTDSAVKPAACSVTETGRQRVGSSSWRKA